MNCYENSRLAIGALRSKESSNPSGRLSPKLATSGGRKDWVSSVIQLHSLAITQPDESRRFLVGRCAPALQDPGANFTGVTAVLAGRML
jgi:hypothetical protein